MIVVTGENQIFLIAVIAFRLENMTKKEIH